MLHEYTICLQYDIIHTQEDRLNYLNSLKQDLEKVKNTRTQIEHDVKLTVNRASKKLLQEKLDKYNKIVAHMEFSVRLAQRDYDNALKQIEKKREYVNYLLNRSR